jgi:LysM repeat protein
MEKSLYIGFSILLICCLMIHKSGFPQEEPIVKQSMITETIDGQDYYLHFVKQGETLFAIARVYNLTVDAVFKTNPEARNGISAGDVLKIPVDEVNEDASEIPQNTQKQEYFYHIVKKQETLYGISRKYGVPIDSIKTLNPSLEEYPKTGETLKIPRKTITNDQSIPKWEGPTTTHRVVAGETLYGIAKKYNITTGEILNANPGQTEQLAIGTELLIPQQETKQHEATEENSESEAENPAVHKVIAGETLYSIARNFAVSIDTLKNYNPGLSSSLYIGQEIQIPKPAPNTEYIIHQPKSKEKLKDISEKYSVNTEELEEMNPNIGKKAKKGQVVKIPVEVPEKEEVVNKAEEVPDPVAEIRHCFEHDRHHSSTYNIALMLPLFLEETDSIDFQDEKSIGALSELSSLRFVNFYSGFQMAVDSLVDQGLKINLFVYDVDNNPEKADKVLAASELSSMDLIVGPFYLNAFRKVARFANTYRIPILNPLSQRQEIIQDNPWVYKIKPSEEKQLDQLVEFLVQNHPKSNIILLRNNRYKYQKETSFIRNSLNRQRSPYIYLQNQAIYEALSTDDDKDSWLTENKVLKLDYFKEHFGDSSYFSNVVREVIYVNDSLTGLTMNLSRIRPNLVVAISDEVVFSKEMLSQLNKLRLEMDITLLGIPTWNDFPDLETSHILNLGLHTFTPSLVNYNNPRIKNWITAYRLQYNTEPTPGNLAFDGFDAGWFFLNALYNYGKDFGDCLEYLSVPLIQTQFRFEKERNNGYENTYWNMGYYDHYEFNKIQLNQE